MSRTANGSLTAPPLRFRFGGATLPTSTDVGPEYSFKLLLLFLLIFYSNIAKLYPPLEALRPAFVVAMSAVGVMVIELARQRTGFRLAWPQAYLLAAFLGIAGVSTFSALYFTLAFNTTIELIKVVLIYLLLENTVTSESRIRTVLWTLVIGGLFPAIGTLVYHQRGIFVEGTRAAWIGTYANPNEVAYALVLLVPIAGVLALTSKMMPRLVLLGIIGTYLLAIYVTFSRGGLLGLFAVLAVFGWKQKSLALRAVMIAGLVLGLVLMGSFWGRSVDFSNLRSDTTVNQRIATIKAGLLMFADNPLLGVGPGNSIVAYPFYVPKDAHCGCQEQLVIHNAFIQVLSEVGILGTIPFLAMLGVTIFQLWWVPQSGPNTQPIGSYALGIELALWGFLACGVSGGFSYSWYPYIFVGLGIATKRVLECRA